MNKKIKYIVLLTCSLTLVGCSESSSIERWIDNPTANEIKVIIDGDELTIPAKSGVNYTFSYGKHTMSYNNDSLNFIVKPAKFSDSGFINPTQSNYLLYTIIYATSNMDENEYNKVLEKELNRIPAMINGEESEIELPVKIVNDVFIERSNYHWSYSFDQSFPEEITQDLNLKKHQSYYERFKKLYRESDFIEHLKQDGVKEEISFPYHPKKFIDIVQYVIPNIDVDNIKCEEGRQYMKNLLNDWNQLITLKGDAFEKSFKKIGTDDAIIQSYASEKKCTKDNDPDQSYHKTLGQFLDALRNARDVNFYVIK
ncbi:hypothetical protein [Gilliamella sp. App4-10]|uniref:hypothetical protein n=1 Tax=Gilliamella sp. App4-10 TaxID=3120231 RepID=UPI00080DD87B|nr:hypothetical protein [Gilliamella apicola]